MAALINFEEIDMDNLNYLLKQHDFKNKNLIVGLDIMESMELDNPGVDLVVYDTTNMLGLEVESVEDFRSTINENGLDEEEFEIDRATLVRIK